MAGLLVKASGLTVPQTATTFLAHLGNDSLAMGLLCIGAGLRLHDFRDHLALITTSVVCRLLAVPAIAWGAVTLAGLDPVEAGVATLFAAPPTAQSCYVMTASMKGDAPSVANVTTAQTLAATTPRTCHIITYDAKNAGSATLTITLGDSYTDTRTLDCEVNEGAIDDTEKK